PPEIMADDGDGRRAGEIVCGCEVAAQSGPHTECLKEIVFDRSARHSLRPLFGDIAHVVRVLDGGHCGEWLGWRLPALLIATRVKDYLSLAGSAERLNRHADVHQPGGIAIRQRAKQN